MRFCWGVWLPRNLRACSFERLCGRIGCGDGGRGGGSERRQAFSTQRESKRGQLYLLVTGTLTFSTSSAVESCIFFSEELTHFTSVICYSLLILICVRSVVLFSFIPDFSNLYFPFFLVAPPAKGFVNSVDFLQRANFRFCGPFFSIFSCSSRYFLPPSALASVRFLRFARPEPRLPTSTGPLGTGARALGFPRSTARARPAAASALYSHSQGTFLFLGGFSSVSHSRAPDPAGMPAEQRPRALLSPCCPPPVTGRP